MALNTYSGFSTVNPTSLTTGWTLTSTQLVKTDLLNQFSTRLGERVMRPTFGNAILDMLFQPKTDLLLSQMLAECQRIISSDPRVTLQNANIFKILNGGVRIEITIIYVKMANLTETLWVNFEQNESTSTGYSINYGTS